MTVKPIVESSDQSNNDSELWSRFHFDMPIELVKAGETEAGWKIRGVASTENKDLQGEIVKQRGLDISPIKEGRGWINYNHSNSPEDMVGKLDDASVGDKGLFVEGYLFKKHQRAQSIYQIMKSLDDKDRHAVKLSIEGKILKRGGRDNKIINNAKVDKVAITFDPINVNTYVELCKALTGPDRQGENMEKALQAEERDIIASNDIMTPDDQAQFNDPANAAGGAEAPTQKRPNEGIDLPGKEYSGQQKERDPNVFELLGQIKDMLSVLVADKVNKSKADTAKEIADLVKSMLIEKLGLTK